LCNSVVVDCITHFSLAHELAEKHIFWKGEAMKASRIGKGLAGATAMASGSAAFAVVGIAPPSDIPATVGTTTATTWNPDGVGAADFNFQFRFPNSTGTGVVWQSNMNPVNGTATGNAVAGYLGAFINYATNFSGNATAGQQIGPNIPNAGAPSWRTAAQVTLGSIYSSAGVRQAYGGFGNGAPLNPAHTNPGGSGPPNETGFVGFRIGTGAATRYGWLQVRTNSTVGIDFIAAALGDPGEPVNAGVVPEPASLGLLALGATALLRRKH
jgi:hypothetical protein